MNVFNNKMSQFLSGIYNSWPWKSVAGQKRLAPTKNLENFPAIGRMSTPHYWPDTDAKTWVKNQALTVSNSKLLYQVVVFVEAYPYAKKQHHCSIQSWHVWDLILRITFGRLRYAGPHPYKWTVSNSCICVCLTTCKKSFSYLQ